MYAFGLVRLVCVWFGLVYYTLQGSGPPTPAPLQRAVPVSPLQTDLKQTPWRPSGALPIPPGPGNSAGPRARAWRELSVRHIAAENAPGVLRYLYSESLRCPAHATPRGDSRLEAGPALLLTLVLL